MTPRKTIRIVKADGSIAPFDAGRLRSSLRRAGAEKDVIDSITEQIEQELVEGMTTDEIYHRAFSLLKKTERPLAARYSMKRALAAFGPSGFPFERFVAEIFNAHGYKTSVGSIVGGKCAEHEVDIVLSRGGSCIGAELKFHNRHNTKSDLKDALYVHARFEDIKRGRGCVDGRPLSEGWLITNTKFTTNAIAYGACVGLHMISWGYPKSGNLRELIESAGVQPVTALTTLSQKEKAALLGKDLVLCRAIHEKTGVLRSLGIPQKKIDAVVAESGALCGA